MYVQSHVCPIYATHNIPFKLHLKPRPGVCKISWRAASLEPWASRVLVTLNGRASCCLADGFVGRRMAYCRRKFTMPSKEDQQHFNIFQWLDHVLWKLYSQLRRFFSFNREDGYA